MHALVLGSTLACQNKHHCGKWAGTGGTGAAERELQDSEAAGSDEDITHCSFLEMAKILISYQTLYFIIHCRRFLYDLF